MASFGPKLRTKPPVPSFKSKLKMPKLLRKKRLVDSGIHLATGMFKGIKKKPMFPKKKIKL